MQWKNFLNFVICKNVRFLGHNLRYGFFPEEITFLMNAILFPYLSVKYKNVLFKKCSWIISSVMDVSQLCLLNFGLCWLSAKLFVLSTSMSNIAAPMNKLTWMKKWTSVWFAWFACFKNSVILAHVLELCSYLSKSQYGC